MGKWDFVKMSPYRGIVVLKYIFEALVSKKIFAEMVEMSFFRPKVYLSAIKNFWPIITNPSSKTIPKKRGGTLYKIK